MSRPSGLGRGLSALIPSAGPGQSGLITLPLSSIVPNSRQPRTGFDDEALAELAHSLREVGLLQPIVVRPSAGGRYEVVAGERRLRAARLAGFEEIPAVVRHTDDANLLTEALVENIHRTDLNPLEEAAAYQQLIDDFGMTHDALATKLGRSRSTITNALRLLGLAPEVQQRIATGMLSAGHARAILALGSREQQERVARRVVAEGLSVRATEDLVRRLVGQPDGDGTSAMTELARAAQARRASPYGHVERRLSDALATRVQVRGSARRGRVVIDFSGQADLQRLLEVLSRGTGEDLLNE